MNNIKSFLFRALQMLFQFFFFISEIYQILLKILVIGLTSLSNVDRYKLLKLFFKDF